MELVDIEKHILSTLSQASNQDWNEVKVIFGREDDVASSMKVRYLSKEGTWVSLRGIRPFDIIDMLNDFYASQSEMERGNWKRIEWHLNKESVISRQFYSDNSGVFD